MAWDAAEADRVAGLFAEDLETLATSSAEARQTLRELASMWRQAYRVSGHKRLARVLIMADLGEGEVSGDN